MPDFSSADALVDGIRARMIAATRSLGPEYAEISKMVGDDARGRLGSYHEQEGPFPGWAPLEKSTMDERERLGFTRNEPELRTGALHDAIRELPTSEAAIVAVPDEMVTMGNDKPVNIAIVAEAQEHGDEHLPPRPFMGPALWAKREEAIGLINVAIARKLEE